MPYDPLLAKKGDQSPFGRLLGSKKRKVKLIPLPGHLGSNGEQVALRSPLSDLEVAQARVDAQKFCVEELKLDALKLAMDNNSVYEEELERQTLVRALRDPTNPDYPFASIEDLRIGLNAETRSLLFKAYNDMKKLESPPLDEEDPEKIKQIVAALGKEQAESLFVSYYERGMLARIVIELVAQLTRPPTQNSANT